MNGFDLVVVIGVIGVAGVLVSVLFDLTHIKKRLDKAERLVASGVKLAEIANDTVLSSLKIHANVAKEQDKKIDELRRSS